MWCRKKREDTPQSAYGKEGDKQKGEYFEGPVYLWGLRHSGESVPRTEKVRSFSEEEATRTGRSSSSYVDKAAGPDVEKEKKETGVDQMG